MLINHTHVSIPENHRPLQNTTDHPRTVSKTAEQQCRCRPMCIFRVNVRQI